jgi:hypothetical protein
VSEFGVSTKSTKKQKRFDDSDDNLFDAFFYRHGPQYVKDIESTSFDSMCASTEISTNACATSLGTQKRDFLAPSRTFRDFMCAPTFDYYRR